MDTLRLSLERPYKDSSGEYIPVLLDIDADGQQIYEPRPDLKTKIGENLRRLCIERPGFFDKPWSGDESEYSQNEEDEEIGKDEEEVEKTEELDSKAPMTLQQLARLHNEVLPQLHTAFGEMSHARDLITLLVSASPTNPSVVSSALNLGPSSSTTYPPLPNLRPSTLSTTTVSKPPPIPSVAAFNAQLNLSSKDTSLRKAARLFKDASFSISKSGEKSEKFWDDALKVRAGNWGLMPAPLPYGGVQTQTRGMDRTSKDFMICFGLEDAPPGFKRRGMAHLSTEYAEETSSPLVFPQRQRSRLLISCTTVDPISGNPVTSQAELFDSKVAESELSVDEQLLLAQTELLEQEIFQRLLEDSGKLPSANVRVSERLIEVEATQGVDVKFELVDPVAPTGENPLVNPQPSFIGILLPILLLRYHYATKMRRLAARPLVLATSRNNAVPAAMQQPLPSILQIIIDMMQYKVFCDRVEEEITKLERALLEAGLKRKIRFRIVGEADGGKGLVEKLSTEWGTGEILGGFKISGEAVVRIDNVKTLRFTMTSPSTLIVHLPQATLPIGSIPQLCQLLTEELEEFLLERTQEIGRKQIVEGTWFVDRISGRVVGRWSESVMTFRYGFEKDYKIGCEMSYMKRGRETGYYEGGGIAGWIEDGIASRR